MTDDPRTETFYWDEETGEPCPREGNDLCTLPYGADHRHTHTRPLPTEAGDVVLTEAEQSALRIAVDKDEDCSCCVDNNTSHLFAAVERILAQHTAAALAARETETGLRDLSDRLAKAADTLSELATSASGDAAIRLRGKREGVLVAQSYVDEAAVAGGAG